jgi:hypothetical protein
VSRVRGAGSGAQDRPDLVAGTLGALWRWRVELALLALPVVAWRLLARQIGDLAAGALVGWAVGPCWCRRMRAAC